jgi:rRNA maturation endonuclease Nob1
MRRLHLQQRVAHRLRYRHCRTCRGYVLRQQHTCPTCGTPGHRRRVGFRPPTGGVTR